MNYGDYLYIWQAPDWPQWRYDLAVLARPFAEVSRAQGLLLGRLADVGVSTRDQASLLALTDDVVKTSEIEGVTDRHNRATPDRHIGASLNRL